MRASCLVESVHPSKTERNHPGARADVSEVIFGSQKVCIFLLLHTSSKHHPSWASVRLLRITICWSSFTLKSFSIDSNRSDGFGSLCDLIVCSTLILTENMFHSCPYNRSGLKCHDWHLPANKHTIVMRWTPLSTLWEMTSLTESKHYLVDPHSTSKRMCCRNADIICIYHWAWSVVALHIYCVTSARGLTHCLQLNWCNGNIAYNSLVAVIGAR